jgi:hypothetical protein
MLSSADVLKLESLLPRGRNPREYLSWRFRIDQLMRQPAITIGPREPIETAASLMTKHGIHALPVTNPQQKLIGIVTTTDIMNAALHPEPRGARRALAKTQEKSAQDVKVSSSEMQSALSLAVAACGGEDDKAQIARALVEAYSRLRQLEALRSWADRYVHLRQDEYLHGALLKAVEQTGNPGIQPGMLPI